MEQIPRAEGKAKIWWMTEDILDLMEKKRQVKDYTEKYESLQKGIMKKM